MYLSPIHDSFIVLPNTSIHLNLTKKKCLITETDVKEEGALCQKNSALEAKVSPLSFSDCWIRSARLSHCVLLVFSNTDRQQTKVGLNLIIFKKKVASITEIKQLHSWQKQHPEWWLCYFFSYLIYEKSAVVFIYFLLFWSIEQMRI